MKLLDYQNRGLETLREYFREAAEVGAKSAFVQRTERPYRDAPNMSEAVPYVCLKVPTGGGKTLMAANALGIAAREYTHAGCATFLWLAPTSAIVSQTLKHLKNPRSPYRLAAARGFEGDISVMTIAESLRANRTDIDAAAWIVVGTLQSFRREDSDGLKVFGNDGDLKHHFDGIPAELRTKIKSGDDGELIYSLANLLRMRRPIIIMDEAHNARTKLSLATLAYFNPACIIEFTATPQTVHNPAKNLFASNILYQTSASELKAAEMIKLPIKLYTAPDWRKVVGVALEQRKELEIIAQAEEKETGEYIRPIALHQAQPRGQDNVTVGELKKSLMDDFSIPENQIAIATGEINELKNAGNILSPDCEIRHIITVKAIAEGWDCPFAYVLCSVANISTPKSVEQILGRILRMPNARKKRRKELNFAYAFAASQNFLQTAASLKSALVEGAGFQRMEEDDLVTWESKERSLFGVSTTTDNSKPGKKSPRKPLRIPLLAVRIGGKLEIFEETHILDSPWDLAKCDSDLGDFSPKSPSVKKADIDVDKEGQIKVCNFALELRGQMAFIVGESGCTVAALVNRLDRRIRHRGVFGYREITQVQSGLFIHRAVTGVIERGFSMEELARDQFRLEDAVAKKIGDHRAAQRGKAHQKMLLKTVATSPDNADPEMFFTFDEDKYSSDLYYSGGYQFKKHLFPKIGELKSSGQEFDCACTLDQMPQVEVWVRNLDSCKESSFWLQTATDRFYPDFVARLCDGRILVVEYKGEDRWSNDDSKEKCAIGEIWAERNGHIFVMPKGPDWAAIESAIAPKKKSARKAN